MKATLWMLLLTALVSSTASGQGATRSLAEQQYPDLDRFVYWLVGHWDNRAQVEKETLQDLDPMDRHPWRPMHYVRVAANNIDGVVLALHTYGDRGFAGPPMRISLHRFTYSPRHDHVVHEFLNVKNRDRFGPFDGRLELLRDLTWGDVSTESTCNMYWKWDKNHFAGQTLPGLCVTQSFSEQPIRIEARGELWDDRLVRDDRSYRQDGSEIARPGGQVPEIYDKLD
jgi:hypothetical protein